MISQWWLYGRKWPSPPSAKKEIKSPKNKIVPRSLKFSKPPSYKTQGEGVGGVHTMENKDTNTDYQKIVRVGDQKWEIVESTFGIILFEIHIHYFLYREFSTPTPPKVHSNDPHLKCQFPPKITIWHKSLLYTRSEKWLNLPPLPHHPGGGGGGGCFHNYTNICIHILPTRAMNCEKCQLCHQPVTTENFLLPTHTDPYALS